jgi:hypothetical protein
MSFLSIIILTIGVSAIDAVGQGKDATTPGVFLLDPPTLQSIGMRWYIDGDDNGNAVCTVAYRRAGTDTWQEALPMLRINRETVDRDFDSYGENSGRYTVGNLFAGSVLFLTPDTEYEIALSLHDPDGGEAPRTAHLRTRAVPYAPAPQRTLHLYPAGFSGATDTPAYTNLRQAFAALQPGDLLLIYPGVYAGGATLGVSGTATAPIVIRGMGNQETIIENPSNQSYNLVLNDRQHVFIENLALRGGHISILAQRTRYLTVRQCAISGAKFGLYNTRENSSHWYIADNTLTGTDAHWVPRTQADAAETGIVLYGQGHVVEYNRIRRFWDALTIADFGRPPGGVDGMERHCVAIDFNNNDLSESRDDLIETDFGSHNIRVFDNRLYNGHTGCSVQPLYGGPVYFVGNLLYGIDGSAFKLHNWPSGIYLFNNTSITSGMPFRSAPLWQNATFRNNLFLGAAPGYTMESGSPDPRTSLDYNGWSLNSSDPNSFIKFTDTGTLTGASQYRFATLEALHQGTGNSEHSILVDMEVFVDAEYPAPGTTYDPTTTDLRLNNNTSPVDAGVRLPNITRTTTGTAPDLGAYERGRPQPHYGPRPLGPATAVTRALEIYEFSQPQDLTLEQNTPNPFNANTTIRFHLPNDETVELTIYNLAGQQVAELLAGHRAAGTYVVQWDGRDRAGQRLAGGVYVYRLQMQNQVKKRKLLLLK